MCDSGEQRWSWKELINTLQCSKDLSPALFSAQAAGLTSFYMGEKYPVSQQSRWYSKATLERCLQHPGLASGITPGWTHRAAVLALSPAEAGCRRWYSQSGQPGSMGPMPLCRCPLCSVNTIRNRGLSATNQTHSETSLSKCLFPKAPFPASGWPPGRLRLESPPCRDPRRRLHSRSLAAAQCWCTTHMTTTTG